MSDTIPEGATFHPCPAPDLPPVPPPRPFLPLDLHSRVTIPDGRTGTVVATRVRWVRGQSSPLGYQVRLDGAAESGPHPWFVAAMLGSAP